MSDPISLAISILALFIAALTAWLTLFRRGTVKMTQPATIYFGPDSTYSEPLPKIYLRMLLFSTSVRGRVVENIFVEIRRGQTTQNFSIWVYEDGKLVRGSGLYVGQTGIATSHHFLTPDDGKSFQFLEGDCQINVFIRLYGERRQRLLFSQKLSISSENAKHLKEPNTGLYFDWSPVSLQYVPHLETKKFVPLQEDVLRQIISQRSNDRTDEASV